MCAGLKGEGMEKLSSEDKDERQLTVRRAERLMTDKGGGSDEANKL